jgi:large subunit ribosomal protein L15
MANKTYLSNMTKLVERKSKRVGRGHGSGKVKTSGRGTKGQNSRGTMKLSFEGGQLPLIKRLPLLRGKGKNLSMDARFDPKSEILNVLKLNDLPAKSEVDLELLKKSQLIDKGTKSVKVIGTGVVKVALSVQLPCSAGAKSCIEKAGGTVLTGNHE